MRSWKQNWIAIKVTRLTKQTQVSGLCNTIAVEARLKKLNSFLDKFVQIVHDPSHWIVVTNMGALPDAVKVYCSLVQKPSAKCLQHILHFTNNPAILRPQKAYGRCNVRSMSYRITLDGYIYFSLVCGLETVNHPWTLF